MTALSSISHNGGQSFGVESKLRREKFVQPDGTVEEIPIISGNGMRGMLRDRGMLHMCRQLGYGVNDATGEVSGLSLAAFYFLFSGGALTSTGSRGIDIDEARRVRGLIPLVGVFGGAMGNSIVPGKCKIGKAIPICAETLHLLPESFQRAVPSIWDYLQREMYTRKDDEKNENLRQLIAPDVRGLLEVEHKKAALKKATNQPQADTGQHQQMMYFVETFAAGTPFYWQITLDDVTEIEFEAMVTTLIEWSKLPYIGGKSNVGLGEVAVHLDNWLEIDSRLTPDGHAIATPIGAAYAQHLQEHGRDIRDLLTGMR
jgi:CRISPR type IV-associated protein Csf2